MHRCATLAALALAAMPATGALGQTFTTLHVFTGGADGAQPETPLLFEHGYFYGGNEVGGANGYGTLFKFDPSTGSYAVLASFIGGDHGEGADGQLAYLNGSIFVTGFARRHGGTVNKVQHDSGAIVRIHLAPKAEDTAPGLTALNGALYGATYDTLYRLDAGDRAYTTLATFGPSQRGASGAMTVDKGLLYGVTSINPGTIFSYDPATNIILTLATFHHVAQGSMPNGGLVYMNGLLYGTTYLGGAENGSCQGMCGVVYSIDPATGAETVLHAFTGPPNDGSNPTSSLIYTFGMIYGTTKFGGAYNQGTVFQIDPATGAESVLHSFDGSVEDGNYPETALAVWNGALYGTTTGGAGGTQGTIFKIVP